MNEIQQNARDLIVGLRELKWKAFEQQLLTPPDEDNFDCATFADVVPEEYKEELQDFLATLSPKMQDSVLRDLLPTVETTDERLQRLEEDSQALQLIPAVQEAPGPGGLFANEDTSHLPQQIRQQITFITGEYV